MYLYTIITNNNNQILLYFTKTMSKISGLTYAWGSKNKWRWRPILTFGRWSLIL